MKTKPPFLTLARNPGLDQETAFAICRMLDSVGRVLLDDWDWDWLEKKRQDYRSLIDLAIVEPAWKLLLTMEWFSLQTVSNHDKKISTIAPLEGMLNLRTLVLQNNLITDLSPLSRSLGLKALNCFRNRIRDLTPLRTLQSLEELGVAENPVGSFQALEDLPNLRKLYMSASQIPGLSKCKRLGAVQALTVSDDGVIKNFVRFPEMPALKVFTAWNAKELTGIERFASLETLGFFGGKFSSLNSLATLKELTHLTICTSTPVSVEPLRGLYALRYLSVNCPKVRGLTELARLPALREIEMDDESTCDAKELGALRKNLTEWDAEFKADGREVQPSLHLEIVDQETFDYYDTKAAFGIRSGECNEGMLDSEREWLLAEIKDALGVKFEDEKEFELPYTSGFRRSERLIIYGVDAYESFREIVTLVQEILCQTRNDWIIWCQSLLRESPEEQEIPAEMEDFVVWIYPDKIVATEENGAVVRKLIEWR